MAGRSPGRDPCSGGLGPAHDGLQLLRAHFGSYDKTFGSLGAAVVLMVWMYMVGMILLLGGELNAAIGGRNDDRAAT